MRSKRSGDRSKNVTSPIFALLVKGFLAELKAHAPDIAAARRAAVAAGTKYGNLFCPAPEHFGGFNPLSVDYAVMERTNPAAMVPAAMGWSDIGSWDALHAALEHDEDGNTIQGTAELVDCKNVFVSSDGPRVSIIGLEDAIVLVGGDEVLLTTRIGAQRVGKLTGTVNQ